MEYDFFLHNLKLQLWVRSILLLTAPQGPHPRERRRCRGGAALRLARCAAGTPWRAAAATAAATGCAGGGGAAADREATGSWSGPTKMLEEIQGICFDSHGDNLVVKTWGL